MKVPKYIKQAIEKNAFHAKKADENNALIRNWLEKQGIVVSEGFNSCGHEIVIDMLIDTVEQLHNADDFIYYLENYDID